MSLPQHKSRYMEKPPADFGYGQSMAPTNVNPFSIRNYVLMSRQKNITQSWPFSQKHLNLCLDNGVSNILPPLNFAVNEKEDDDFGKIPLEETMHLLCGKLGRLSLSFDGKPLVVYEGHLTATSDAQIAGNINSFKALNSDRIRKRKCKKKKSLAEILVVAKHCILDGNHRIFIPGHGSSRSVMQNVDEKRKRKVNINSRSHEPKEDFSSMKKHQRCDDSVPGIGRFNKRSCTMGVIDYRNDGCNLKSWSRRMNSCKTAAETEMKRGGYKRKAGENRSNWQDGWMHLSN